MKKVLVGLAVALMLALASPNPAEAAEKVSVSRSGDNLYKVHLSLSMKYIVTSSCYEYVYYSDAVVNTAQTEITFSDGTTCTIKKIIT